MFSLSLRRCRSIVTQPTNRKLDIVTSFFNVRRLRNTISLSSASSDVLAEADVLKRQQEYEDCLLYNAMAPHVAHIVLLVEGVAAYQRLLQSTLPRITDTMQRLHNSQRSKPHTDPSSMTTSGALSSPSDLIHKIVPVLVSDETQPTYSDLFQVANRFLKNRLVMVCNSDVHVSTSPDDFDVDGVHQLFSLANEGRNNDGEARRTAALALTRYEAVDQLPFGHPRHLTRQVEPMTSPFTCATMEGFRESGRPGDAPLITDYRGSHDAFVIRPPLSQDFLDRVRHPQNCYKAENIVLYELQTTERCAVWNPSKSIKIVHRHAADVRQWGKPVDEVRYGRAAPTTLEEAMEMASKRR